MGGGGIRIPLPLGLLSSGDRVDGEFAEDIPAPG